MTISRETAERIWCCHQEIAASEKLIADIEQELERGGNDKYAGSLKDAFGRRRNLQLGIPCGEDSHRLFDVAPQLAISVIRAHIEHKRAELGEATEQARLELDFKPRAKTKAEV